jgi:ATP-dependent DNA ligase
MLIKDFKYFYPEKPRLIHESQIEDKPGYVAEPKFNGIRLCLHHLPDGRWEFWNRHGEKISYKPNQEVIDALEDLKLKGYWLFDGELRHGKVKGIKHKIVLYDVFIADHHLLYDKTLEERRFILETLFHYAESYYECLQLTAQYDKDFKKMFESFADNDEIEGIVIKKLSGILNLSRTSGQDSDWMTKVRKATKNYKF